ncbi:hypothetical protein DNH61_11865 [Paenibacillus sambharensis]|uniref:Lipoprotein n=1 Tax=Paenibacillus sambharensis TaxID=1803190 RepID=A0A2W1L8V1_9BACL|nr:hypothetical protein [Paenibacillus sambharensis]PZD95249.1 hypothetical protein DNH61_11865 [Paenibacillus sambharensis]
MKHKQSRNLLIIYLLLLTVVLSACQSTQNDRKQQSENTKVAQNIQHLNEQEKIPEYLPKTFPLPQDAKISTSHAEINDGKKSVMLIFTTEESMFTITKLYTDYFNTQNLDQSNYTIDNNNIIIQGDNVKNNESWSMIGGALTSRDGIIELTVNWSEQ